MKDYSIKYHEDGTKTISDNVKGVTQRLDHLHRVQLPLTCQHPKEYQRVHTVGNRYFTGGELYDNIRDLIICTLCGAVLDDDETEENSEIPY